MSVFNDYFVRPFFEGTGYNHVNTLVYSVIFILFVLFLFKSLKKLGLKIDKNFLKALIPFVLLASVVRSLTDQGVYDYTFFTVSPGIYLTITVIASACLLVSMLVEKRFGVKYHEFLVVLGSFLFASQLVQLDMKHWDAFIQILLLFGLMAVPTVLMVKRFGIGFLNGFYPMLALLGQFIDASATAIAVAFHGFWEQHVLTRWVFELTGSAFSMIPVKIIAGILIVFAVDRWEDNPDFRNFLYFAMIVLGWGPGLRDSLSALALP